MDTEDKDSKRVEKTEKKTNKDKNSKCIEIQKKT